MTVLIVRDGLKTTVLEGEPLEKVIKFLHDELNEVGFEGMDEDLAVGIETLLEAFGVEGYEFT